jgi:4-hydroxy-tetrahydrodipicolinate synthase
MGEASTLSPREHAEIIGAAVRMARGRVAVIAGASSNSTSQAIELTASAEARGADAILSVVPYYNKPMQAGMLAHFRAIAASTALPIIVHDNPSRTMREISDETILRLAESPQFAGLNESTGNLARFTRLRSILPGEFRLLCGSDVHAMAYLTSGGDGCISVLANLFPELCRRGYDQCMAGSLSAVIAFSARFGALNDVLAADSPVAALKYGMSRLGHMKPFVRLPLVELGEDAKAVLAAAMTTASADHRSDPSGAGLPAARRSHSR